jgi:hypothetical protein
MAQDNSIRNTIRMATLQKFRSQAAGQGLSKRNVRPHVLRLYAALNPSINGFEIILDRKINSSVHPLSNGLDESDAFVADGMSLGIHATIGTGATALYANTYPVFFPDARLFTGANEARDLEILYNARLQMESNQDIRLQDYDTWQFRTVPETQFNAVANTAPTIPNTGCEIKSLDTAIAFAGGDTNRIKVTWNAGSYAAIGGVADTRTNYAVIFLDGIIIKNGAQPALRGELFKLLS